MTSEFRTVEEWMQSLGESIRNARIARGLDQRRLSELANVSVAAISSLETGKGSSLKTLISVVRAVGRTDWLETLSPSVTISPLQTLRAKQRAPRPRKRVRSSKSVVKG